MPRPRKGLQTSLSEFDNIDEDSECESHGMSLREFRRFQLRQELQNVGIDDIESLSHHEMVEIVRTAKTSLASVKSSSYQSFDLEENSSDDTLYSKQPSPRSYKSNKHFPKPEDSPPLFMDSEPYDLMEDHSPSSDPIELHTGEMNVIFSQETLKEEKEPLIAADKSTEASDVGVKRHTDTPANGPSPKKLRAMKPETPSLLRKKLSATWIENQFKLAFVRWRQIMDQYKHPFKMVQVKRLDTYVSENIRDDKSGGSNTKFKTVLRKRSISGSLESDGDL